MQHYLSKCVGRYQTVLLVNVLQKFVKTPFKGDYLKTLIKTSNYENLVLYFSWKVLKIAAFAVLSLVFGDQTIA